MKLYFFPDLATIFVTLAKSLPAALLLPLPLYTETLVAQMTESEKQTIKEVDEDAIAYFQKHEIKFYFAQAVATNADYNNIAAQVKEFNVDKD
jgi:hypothetical protein